MSIVSKITSGPAYRALNEVGIGNKDGARLSEEIAQLRQYNAALEWRASSGSAEGRLLRPVHSKGLFEGPQALVPEGLLNVNRAIC